MKLSYVYCVHWSLNTVHNCNCTAAVLTLRTLCCSCEDVVTLQFFNILHTVAVARNAIPSNQINQIMTFVPGENSLIRIDYGMILAAAVAATITLDVPLNSAGLKVAIGSFGWNGYSNDGWHVCATSTCEKTISRRLIPIILYQVFDFSVIPLSFHRK